MTPATLYADAQMYAELATFGCTHVEQGGILLGHAGPYGIHVSEYTTPGPLDVQAQGMILLADPKHEQRLNDSGLAYLGFWHSHPAGTPSEPSLEDLESWQGIARAMLTQQPSVPCLLFPIITGDRIRVWRVDRTPDLEALPLTEVTTWTQVTPS